MNGENFPHINEDYQDFCNQEKIVVPNSLTNRVQQMIAKALNPTGLSVFFKLLGIHFFCSILTLILCPQFGISSINSLKSIWLMSWLSQLGSFACTSVCGGLYLGVSLFTAVLILSPEEIKKLKELFPLQILALLLVSLGFFTMMRAVILVEFALVWGLGCFIGARFFIEIAMRIKPAVTAFFHGVGQTLSHTQ